MTDTTPQQVRGTLRLPLRSTEGHDVGLHLTARIDSELVTFYLGDAQMLAKVPRDQLANWLLDPLATLTEARLKLRPDFGNLLVVLDDSNVYWIHSDHVADLRAVTGAQ